MTNNGNTPVCFRFRIQDLSPFTMNPMSGIAPQFSEQPIVVKYKPNMSRDEAQIKMEVKDGLSKIIKLNGSTNETKIELSHSQINFNCIPVCQRVLEQFFVRNRHKKNFAYFKIDPEKLAEGFQISPLTGRIGPEDHQKFEISFFSSVVTDIKQRKLFIEIRGARPLCLLVSVVTLIPRVEVLEPVYNFGEITYGNKGFLQMTLTNSCNISARVELDLSSSNETMQEKLDCLDIFRETGKGKRNETNKVLETVYDTGQSKESGRKYLIYIKPFKTYTFKLVFIPMKPKNYK